MSEKYGRGQNPNSKMNLKRGNPETQFSGQRATEMAQKSAEARREYKSFREAAKEALTPDVMAEITKAMIEKASAGDVRAYEVIRDTVGEKPSEALELSGSAVKFVLGDNEDDLSG